MTPKLFLFLIQDVFGAQESISVQAIQAEVADRFLCNREGTEIKLSALDEEGFIVYKQDAGRKEIQIKSSIDKYILLNKYYGRV
jgi:hypothetical protein